MRAGKRKRKQNLFAVLLLGIAGICMLVRCFYSFTWSDESYYLTITHRFYLGERMIADEWFTTQLSGPLMLPFYALFQWITGGNEGIYLFFRLLYWAIATFTTLLTYFTLRMRNSVFSSLICSLVYYFYSRANIGGLSYYNMTLTFVLLAVLLIYDQRKRGKVCRIKIYLIGIFLALAVVNTPFLAFPYLLIGMALLISRKYRGHKKEVLRVFAGTALTAIVYLSYVFYKTPIREIIANIPYVLNEPEMQRTNPVMAIPLIIMRIAWRYVWTIGIIAILAVYIWYQRRRKNKLTEKAILWIMVINFIAFVINSYLSANMIGCINIAGGLFLGLTIYLLYDREIPEKSFMGLFMLAGLSLVLSFSFSSDTGLDAMAIGFVLIAIGVFQTALKLPELEKKRILLGAVMVVGSVMVIQTGILRLLSVYRDAPIDQLDTQISAGPAKYLYTTEEHAAQYDELRQAIEECVREGDRVFYSKSCFWSYLCTDNAYGTPSSWRMAFDNPRLEEYFRIKPEKIPTCIFIIKPEYGSYESSMIQGNEKEEFPNSNNEEGFLYDYVMEHNYEKIERRCATIYRTRLEGME